MQFLAIGDSHIPRRANNIPERIINKLDELTKDEPFEYTFFTGDLIKCPECIELLKSITNKELFIVVGNMDNYDENEDVPFYQELDYFFSESDKITIGLTHGVQIHHRGDRSALESLAIERKYNVLISGHTHKEEISLTKNGILLINPGSVTGAWSFVSSKTPSFSVTKISNFLREIEVSLFQLNTNSNTISESKFYYIFKDNRIQYRF